jgi:hypothetical protein
MTNKDREGERKREKRMKVGQKRMTNKDREKEREK